MRVLPARTELFLIGLIGLLLRFCPRNGGADAIGKGGARRKAGIRRKLGELLQTGVQKVIVSMGSRGMLHVLPEQTIFVPGLRVPVKDTVGAGDAVIAALAVAEERGLTLEETLRLSTAAGAASVMCTGTQAASLETIQQLMEQVTYREL